MNKALRLILALVLVCAGAGHAWARGGLTIITVSPNPVGGTIDGFYSDADCSQSITDEGFEPPLSIYFRATPDNDHELGTADANKVVSFIKAEVVMTGDAQQARHRAIDDEGGQAGWFVDVKESGNGVYYFTVPDDFDKTIMAIRITATFPKSIAYAVLTDNNDGVGTKTLTFKYEEHTVSGTNEWDVSNTDVLPGWYKNRESITKVVFESTFANARPKSCNYWFHNCNNLTTITGLNYLNTSEVTNMTVMFYGCSGLTSLDVSSFNTSNVTNMLSMFDGCSSLTSLDVSSFNTSMVDDMSHMFDGCSRLTSLSIGKDFTVIDFYDGDFHIITKTDGMFEGCTALAEGMLIVTGVPSIAQNIFSGVFTNGVLATPLTKDQLGIKETSSPYTWKGGKFKSVGKAKIPYIDADGKLHDDDGTKTPDDTSDDCAEALPITSANDEVILNEGWYFVAGNVNIHGKIEFTGAAHPILCDGAALTVTSKVNNYGNAFTIYGQSTGDGMGKLTAPYISVYGKDMTINGGKVNATARGIDVVEGNMTINGGQVNATAGGIYVEMGHMTINGGQVTATGDYSGIGASLSLTINGGQVTATASENISFGIYSDDILTINGGQVTATSGNNGIHASLSLTINGGQVIANGTNGYGLGSDGGNITLGWTHADDFVQASGFGKGANYSNVVQVAGGKIFKYTEGTGDAATEKKLYEGDITFLATSGTINNVTLTPYGIGGYCGTTANNADGKNLTWAIPLVDHDNDTATPKQLSNVLSIKGSGDINDYSSADDAPWKDYSVSLIFVPTEDDYSNFGASLNPTDNAKLVPNEISLTKNASGWSTYCHNYLVNYSLSDGNTGDNAPKTYTVSGLSSDGKSVAITAATDNYVAPATPLLLGYTGLGTITLTALPETAKTFEGTDALVSTTDTGWAFYGNAGNNDIAAADAIYTAEGGFLHVGRDATGTASYVLRDGQFILVDQNQGLAAHRCLLNVSAAASQARTLSIAIDGDGATGITTTDFTDYTDSYDAWYDLQGRKLDKQPTKKGIYVNGDRKVVIR